MPEAKVFVCRNFTRDGVRRRATAVLVQVKAQAKDGKELYAWGCSLGPYCEFSCRYAKPEEGE